MNPTALERPPLPLVIAGRPIPVVGKARVYVCGITPYDVTHLGHAATYIWTDVATRVLRDLGSGVVLTRNITDVDDALLAEAARRSQPYEWLAGIQKFQFDRTMTALRVRPPDHEPTARAAIGQVIQLAQALLDRGAAYLRNGSVYGRTSTAAESAGVSEADALRLADEYDDNPGDPAKEHPLDVAVWRRVAEDDISWPSPWGPGRPGWHAECAAMVLASYGSGVDLHCGGADLAFPHHACETMLAENATGVAPFARGWMRPGTVSLGGKKMAKSTGNLILVEDLLIDHAPAAIRLLCLSRPWSAPWDYTPQLLPTAEETLQQLYAAAGRDGAESAVDNIRDLLRHDLDVPAAVNLALAEGGPAARHLIDVLKIN